MQQTQPGFSWRFFILGLLRRFSPRREILFLARAMAEACVLAPWISLLPMLSTPIPVSTMTGTAFGIILGTSYLVRGMNTLGIGVQVQRILAAGIVLIASAWALANLEFTAVTATLFIIAIIAFLWWRGLELAQKPFSVLDVSTGFQIGVILFAVFLLTSSLETQAEMVNARTEVVPNIVAFFFCQLLAVGLTRVETIGEQRGGRRSPFGGWWATILTVSTAIVVLLASIVVVIVTGLGPERLLDLIGPALSILLVPVSFVVFSFLALTGKLLEWLLSIINLKNYLTEIESLTSAMESPLEMAPTPLPETNQITTVGYGNEIVTVLAIVVVAIGVLWALRQLRVQSKQADQLDEEHESIWSGNTWAARLRERLSEGIKNVTGAFGMFTRFGAGGFFRALTIRRIYAQLQQLAAKRGYPREKSLTPYEYLALLHECFPNFQVDLDRLTEAYVGVHYGEFPEQPEELEKIRAAWDRIRESSLST